jgi:hypothetical protein
MKNQQQIEEGHVCLLHASKGLTSTTPTQYFQKKEIPDLDDYENAKSHLKKQNRKINNPKIKNGLKTYNGLKNMQKKNKKVISPHSTSQQPLYTFFNIIHPFFIPNNSSSSTISTQQLT